MSDNGLNTLNGYEIRVLAGRVLFNGLPIDDLVDHQDKRYSQSSRISRERSIALAFRVGWMMAEQRHGIADTKHFTGLLESLADAEREVP